MNVIFRCPECGRKERGPAEWQNWCACQPVYEIPGGHQRDLVPMQPIPDIPREP